MLVDKNDISLGENSADNTYRIYKNLPSFVYDIKQKYDVSCQNNQIKLTIDYKDLNLTAQTSFSFAKEGQPGTNGTEYLIKLVPNVGDGKTPLFPMLTAIGKQDYVLNYKLRKGGINSKKTITWSTDRDESYLAKDQVYQLFKAQMWKNGVLVWEGYSKDDQALDGVTQPKSVTWSILANKNDLSTFEIPKSNKTNGGMQFGKEKALLRENPQTTALANIIKCQITYVDATGDEKSYYGTIPVSVAYVSSPSYRISLKDYTGFRYVVYGNDGTDPQYDSAKPFEFIFEELINQVWEDTSTVVRNPQLSFYSSSIGVSSYKKEKHLENGKYEYRMAQDKNSNDIRDPKKDENGIALEESKINQRYKTDAKNKFIFIPAVKTDAECKNNAVYCVVKRDEQVAARINIPIHILLNKYGLSNLNGWDGNSIELNNQEGYILAPQMGAGIKQTDNSFTGVLMGKVQYTDEEKDNYNVGLLGYYKGEQTIFLDSMTGAAHFGGTKKGGIHLDPSTENGFIYGGNFYENWRNHKGLPESYSATNETGQGMLIDLTTPQIRFGSGNFSVNKVGHITARGGGSIAGWEIDDHKIWAKTKINGKDSTIGLNSLSKIDSDDDPKCFWIGGNAENTNLKDKKNWSYITFKGHIHFGSNGDYLDFDPAKGGTFKLQQWNITNNDEESRSSIFYGNWENSPVGMSGDPGEKDEEYQYYLWAGLKAENKYLLAVRTGLTEDDGKVELCSGFKDGYDENKENKDINGIYVYGIPLKKYVIDLINQYAPSDSDPEEGPSGTPDNESTGIFEGIYPIGP